jgi:hypothetical protein
MGWEYTRYNAFRGSMRYFPGYIINNIIIRVFNLTPFKDKNKPAVLWSVL